MIITILMAVMAVSMGFLTWVCLFKKGGCNWILLNGENVGSKESKALYRAQNDVPGMNRHLAKWGYLPFAVASALFAVIFAVGAEETTLGQAFIAVSSVIFLIGSVNAVRIYLQIVGGKFARKATVE